MTTPTIWRDLDNKVISCETGLKDCVLDGNACIFCLANETISIGDVVVLVGGTSKIPNVSVAKTSTISNKTLLGVAITAADSGKTVKVATNGYVPSYISGLSTIGIVALNETTGKCCIQSSVNQLIIGNSDKFGNIVINMSNSTPGPTGAIGPTGPAGTQGEQGIQGPAGAVGDAGIAGTMGVSGNPGVCPAVDATYTWCQYKLNNTYGTTTVPNDIVANTCDLTVYDPIAINWGTQATLTDSCVALSGAASTGYTHVPGTCISPIGGSPDVVPPTGNNYTMHIWFYPSYYTYNPFSPNNDQRYEWIWGKKIDRTTYWAATTGAAFRFYRIQSTGPYYDWGFYLTPTTPNSGSLGEYSVAAPSSQRIPWNSWNHICATWDGTNIVLYRNGVEIGSTTVSGGPQSIKWGSGFWSFGNIPDGFGYVGNIFIGKLMDARIETRTWSASDVLAYYNSYKSLL